MTSRPDQPSRCGNPRCACETEAAGLTCSVWCGLPAAGPGARCRCRHDACASSLDRVAAVLADLDLYPAVLDRFRPDRRVASAGRG